ncbi:MAG: DUF1641 domain-containing protein [Ferroplasma sp.]
MTANDLIMKELSKPENMDALNKIIDMLPAISQGLESLDTLKKNGVLESLQGLAYLASSFQSILDDEMIAGIGSLANSFLGLLSATGSPALMSSLDRVSDELASGELGKDIKVKGTFSLLNQLKDPEIQRGLSIMLGLLKTLGKQ